MRDVLGHDGAALVYVSDDGKRVYALDHDEPVELPLRDRAICEALMVLAARHLGWKVVRR